MDLKSLLESAGGRTLQGKKKEKNIKEQEEKEEGFRKRKRRRLEVIKECAPYLLPRDQRRPSLFTF